MLSGSDMQVVRAMELGEAGRHAEAIAVLRRLIARQPDHRDAHNVLGQLMSVTGQDVQALYHYGRALAGDPDSPVYLSNYAGALARSGEAARGIELYRRALERDGSYVPAWVGLGMAAAAARDYGLCIEAGRRAVEFGPEVPQAHQNYALALIEAGRVDEAVAAMEGVVRGWAATPALRSTYLMALNYVSSRTPEEVARAHREVGRALGSRCTPWPGGDDPERPLHVGVLSPDFKTHSVMYFLEPALERRDRRAFRVTLYSSLFTPPDETTRRVRGLADGWVEALRMSDAELEARIRADKVDVLVEAAGHTAGNRLRAIAGKPAPVVVHAIGYPHATGVSAVDARLVDSTTDPPGEEPDGLERPLRLDPCFLCYRPPGSAPAVTGRPPEGPVVFGSFNALQKVSDATLDLWSRVLAASPGSTLLLKSTALSDAGVREQVASRIAARGVEAARVKMLGATPSTAEHLALYGGVDVALDTTPYCGTTTTCEALWMGVPVVTLRGERHAARVGASLLSAVGAPGLVASTADEYVRIAAELASDGARRSRLRGELRGMMERSPLRDEAGYAGRFWSALRQIWRERCAGR